MQILQAPFDAAGMAAYLDINVRREHILHDSLEQFLNRPNDLKKPLLVTFFNNGVAEEGVDQGGVSREFFQLLVAELFDPQYGMFTYDYETRTFWFNSSSSDLEVISPSFEPDKVKVEARFRSRLVVGSSSGLLCL